MSDKAKRVAERVASGVRYGDMSHDEIAAMLREEYPEEPAPAAQSEERVEERPFVDQFVGKAFARKDYAGREFSFGVCERDEGYEITVIPAREGPTRHYRLNPDGTIDDLARAALASERDKGEA